MEPTEDVVDSPVGWVARHIRTYVDSGGTKGQTYGGAPALLLTTRGRTTGTPRRTALICGRHGDDYVVVASNGGSPKHPQWYLNLRADPAVVVQVGPETFPARARDATPEERPDLWRMMTALFRSYASFAKRTDRTIPVVVLQPVSERD
jgi:deazaflavin-dependent oxidoreductase (nitroreductase family)